MKRLIHSIIFRGAASALFVCFGAASAEPSPEVTSLPQWAQRAQARLGLSVTQQQELRALVDANSECMRQLQVRYAGETSALAHRAQRDEMAGLQREFRDSLALILSASQLTEWDVLLEELLGEVHLRNAPRLAEAVH
jgi:hypothetical protein